MLLLFAFSLLLLTWPAYSAAITPLRLPCVTDGALDLSGKPEARAHTSTMEHTQSAQSESGPPCAVCEVIVILSNCILTIVEALMVDVFLLWQTDSSSHTCQQHNNSSEQKTTEHIPVFLAPVFMSVLTCVVVCALLRSVEGRVCCCLSV